MRILVTGGSGTLGGYILRDLIAAGHQVICYCRTPPAKPIGNVCLGDVADFDGLLRACAAQEAIIHLAAVPGPNRASPQQTVAVNLGGTINVLEAARQAGIGKVVFASSAAVLGFTFQKSPMVPQYFPVDEQHPCEPQDEYGLSKLLAELACKSYSQAYGIRTLCLRINHNWYLDREGASQSVQSGWARGLTIEQLWTQRYLRTIRDGEQHWPVPGPPSPRNNLWAVTDARDAAQAFRLAVEDQQLLHEVFFINGDDTCSLVANPILIANHYPDVALRAPIEGYASLVSHQRATHLLGFRPRYSWRQSDFWEWATQQEQRERSA